MHASSSNSTPGRPHSSNSTRGCMAASTLPSILQKRHAPKQHLHQHPKLHQTAAPNSTPLHPAVIVKMRPHRRQHSQNSTCTSTPNCMPKSIRSILQNNQHHHPSPAPQTAPQTAHPNNMCTTNCTPPSTQPSISQITFPSLLEVRTPIAFSYLGK